MNIKLNTNKKHPSIRRDLAPSALFLSRRERVPFGKKILEFVYSCGSPVFHCLLLPEI